MCAKWHFCDMRRYRCNVCFLVQYGHIGQRPPIAEWPASDCLGWTEACQPALRLKRGGAASHLAPVSQADITNRYGLYLDFIINLTTAKALMMGPRRERRRCDDSRHHPKRSEPGVLSVWAEFCRPANESERKR
jgi:hypothetical protein